MELQDKKSRAVANWLILGVAMTIVQIALGGITRITGSGLSITEWDVVTGTLPPMNQAQTRKPLKLCCASALKYAFSTGFTFKDRANQ